MHWKKLGLIYEHQGNHPKMMTHAANPLAVHLHDDIFRIFFSSRDSQNRSSVGMVDIDIVSSVVVQRYNAPVFLHGPENSFFSHGVSIGCIYETSGKRYILFMGWQIPSNQHWRGDIGRLILSDDWTLSLDPQTIYIGSDIVDPVSLSYPWVIQNQNGYSMWYGSTVTWDAGNQEMLHVINTAFSKDGHEWTKQGLSIPFCLGQAQAFSRPTVIQDSHGHYHMWYSYRAGNGDAYKIGKAFSKDGAAWILDNEHSGIHVSDDGWDSYMICYPFVFKHKGCCYMLYNGNDYGKIGFGAAVGELP